jgi:hypothetical protein
MTCETEELIGGIDLDEARRLGWPITETDDEGHSDADEEA